MRARPLLPAITALALLLPATPALAGSPTPKANVDVTINDCDFTGEASLTSGNQLIVKHTSASGALRAKHTVTVDGGDWAVDCPGPKVRPGDKLILTQKGSATPFRTFTVPALTITTDRVRNRVSGNAPGVSSVDILLTGCDVTGTACTSGLTAGVPVAPGTGAYTEVTMDDLLGGAWATVVWRKNADTVKRDQHFAQVIVRPGKAAISGFGRTSGIQASVTVRRAGTNAVGTTTTGPDAAFTTTAKRNGAKRTVKVGDKITSTVASDASFTVPTTSLTPIVGGVEGTCAANGSVGVLYRALTGEINFSFHPLVEGDGHWEVLQSVPADTIVEAWCATDAGDAIVRSFVER